MISGPRKANQQQMHVIYGIDVDVACDSGQNVIISPDHSLPWQIVPALQSARTIHITDLLSFPVELELANLAALLVVAIPEELTILNLDESYGDLVFQQLSPFDRVQVNSDSLWRQLRTLYGWADFQRLRTFPESDRSAVIATLGAQVWHGRSVAPFSGSSQVSLKAQFREERQLVKSLIQKASTEIPGVSPRSLIMGAGSSMFASVVCRTNNESRLWESDPYAQELARSGYAWCEKLIVNSIRELDRPGSFDVIVYTPELSERDSLIPADDIRRAWRALAVGGSLGLLIDGVEGWARREKLQASVRTLTNGSALLEQVNVLGQRISGERALWVVLKKLGGEST